jgi:hypothetical protein
MHWLGTDILKRLVRAKALEYRHVGLLYLLMGEMDPNTGRINITAQAMANQLERDDAQARNLIAALIRHQLIVRWKDETTGQRCFLVHPYLASVGGRARRGYLWKQFSEAIDGRHIYPVPDELEAA